MATGDRIAQAKYCHKFEDCPPKIPQVNWTGSKGQRERESRVFKKKTSTQNPSEETC